MKRLIAIPIALMTAGLLAIPAFAEVWPNPTKPDAAVVDPTPDPCEIIPELCPTPTPTFEPTPTPSATPSPTPSATSTPSATATASPRATTSPGTPVVLAETGGGTNESPMAVWGILLLIVLTSVSAAIYVYHRPEWPRRRR